MKFPSPLQEAIFLSRPNRFTCLVKVPERKGPTRAHLPDPGRLHELLQPGVRLWLEPKPGEQRKTQYQVWLVESERTLISLNTRLPNDLVQEALVQGSLPELAQYSEWERERCISNSRLDFYFKSPNKTCWMEVKSVTLVKNGQGLFPDAPTKRGYKHIKELIRIRQTGVRAVVFFVVQRADAHSVAANDRTDPKFALALQSAYRCGVELIAYTCQLTTEHAVLNRAIPVISE